MRLKSSVENDLCRAFFFGILTPIRSVDIYKKLASNVKLTSPFKRLTQKYIIFWVGFFVLKGTVEISSRKERILTQYYIEQGVLIVFNS